MFNYFKRRREARIAKEKQEIANMPMPYCEDREAHYYWKDDKWGCPMCEAKKAAEYMEKEMEKQRVKLAKAIADEFQKRNLIASP